MRCYLFLLPNLMLWAVIPNVVLKYVLVEVNELTEQDANKGIIYSISKNIWKSHNHLVFKTINMIH